MIIFNYFSEKTIGENDIQEICRSFVLLPYTLSSFTLDINFQEYILINHKIFIKKFNDNKKIFLLIYL